MVLQDVLFRTAPLQIKMKWNKQIPKVFTSTLVMSKTELFYN